MSKRGAIPTCLGDRLSLHRVIPSRAPTSLGYCRNAGEMPPDKSSFLLDKCPAQKVQQKYPEKHFLVRGVSLSAKNQILVDKILLCQMKAESCQQESALKP